MFSNFYVSSSVNLNWPVHPWKDLMVEIPGKNFKKYIAESLQHHTTRVKRQSDFSEHGHKPQKKKHITSKSTQDYGPNARQAPLSVDEVMSEKNRILSKMQVTTMEIARIERATLGQWENPLYEQIRKNRLTASNFGAVIKRRKTTKPDNLIKTILGLRSAQSAAIEYGRNKEAVARHKFAASRPRAHIQSSGIFIHDTYGYLATSPDGLVGDNGILEIKCLYKVHQSGKLLTEAVKTDKTLCVEIVDGRIRLKKNHNYYYQVQGQLNIAQKDMCLFIIYINDQEPLYVDVILRDSNFWENQMLPKLTHFYETYLLDAIANRNIMKANKHHAAT